jgi:hypothetical protein
MNAKREVIYSVMVHVNNDIVAEWLSMMLKEHIPEVMATGCFEAYEVRREIEPQLEGRATFEIRYLSPSIETYQRYQEQYAPRLQAAHSSRYGGRFVATRRVFGSMETRP